MESLHDLQTIILLGLKLNFTFKTKCVRDTYLFYEWNKTVVFQHRSLGNSCLLRTTEFKVVKDVCLYLGKRIKMFSLKPLTVHTVIQGLNQTPANHVGFNLVDHRTATPLIQLFVFTNQPVTPQKSLNRSLGFLKEYFLLCLVVRLTQAQLRGCTCPGSINSRGFQCV